MFYVLLIFGAGPVFASKTLRSICNVPAVSTLKTRGILRYIYTYSSLLDICDAATVVFQFFSRQSTCSLRYYENTHVGPMTATGESTPHAL